jgi:hypothetical protein
MHTTDRNHPELTYGVDAAPTTQAAVYLVLSEDEKAKGFVRPFRDTYVHSCGAATSMSRPIAETYAANPKFYGATYCIACQKHLPVSEFKWEDGSVVGS